MSSSVSLLGPLLAFALIVALIPLSLWLLKRSPLGARLGVPAGTAQGRPMRLVAALSLAPGQRVVTVEVGTGDDRRWLVLGCTPQAIHTLHTLAPQAEPSAAAPAAFPGMAGSFAQLLARQPGGRDAR
ncbi:flagellar biosynthetic protein FliO [Ideonella sp. DXS22W]|uniref:Flagellar biosynthetic protein FliO n=1 Tax=Pseudaquabacterium inlustre TaxID=2984192 RepID=A0ABU9CE26_9BURK